MNQHKVRHKHRQVRDQRAVHPSAIEAVWPDHRKPAFPQTFAEAAAIIPALIASNPHLLVPPIYSTDPGVSCARCRNVNGLPLASPAAVLALLGYR